MSKDRLGTLALLLLGAAVGVGLYDVVSDSDFGTAVLILTSLGFLCVALAQKGKDEPGGRQ